jgi:rhamnose transport system permease protein
MPACAEGASAVPADSTTPTTVPDTAPGAGPPPAAAPDEGFERREGGAWRAVRGRWEALLVALLVLLLPIGQAISPQFLTSDSFTTGSLDFSEIALMALPLTLVVVAAEIDLSIASVLGLSSAVMAALWNAGLPLELIMPLCIVAGALCGAFNGVLVTRLGLPSLAVTIGTLALFRGLAFVVIGDDSVTDFPGLWTDRAIGNFAGTAVPNVIVLFAILAVLFAVLLHFTPFGRSVFAIGANEEAAFFSGLRVKRIKLALFVLSGAVAALAGVVISLRNSTAAANVGVGFELTVITAVLLGGVSIFGGRGTIGGVILALLLLGGIQKALLLSESISSYWIQIVTGVLLVGSVLGPNLVQRARAARAHSSRQRGVWPSRSAAQRNPPQEEKA